MGNICRKGQKKDQHEFSQPQVNDQHYQQNVTYPSQLNTHNHVESRPAGGTGSNFGTRMDPNTKAYNQGTNFH